MELTKNGKPKEEYCLFYQRDEGPVEDFFEDAVIVMRPANHTDKNPKQGSILERDTPKGYRYGLLLDNWYILLVKPTDELKAIWESHVGGAFTTGITEFDAPSGYYRVEGSDSDFMGVSQRHLGIFTKEAFKTWCATKGIDIDQWKKPKVTS